MNRRVLVVLFVAAFLISAIFVTSSYADGKKSDMCKKFYKKAMFLLTNEDELELSAQQVEKIKNLKHETKKELILLDAKIDVLAVDIKALLWADAIDVNAINKLIDQKYDLKKQKAKLLVSSYASLKGVLTSEQMDKAKELWKSCDKYQMKCRMYGKDMAGKMMNMKR